MLVQGRIRNPFADEASLGWRAYGPRLRASNLAREKEIVNKVSGER